MEDSYFVLDGVLIRLQKEQPPQRKVKIPRYAQKFKFLVSMKHNTCKCDCDSCLNNLILCGQTIHRNESLAYGHGQLPQYLLSSCWHIFGGFINKNVGENIKKLPNATLILCKIPKTFLLRR